MSNYYKVTFLIIFFAWFVLLPFGELINKEKIEQLNYIEKNIDVDNPVYGGLSQEGRQKLIRALLIEEYMINEDLSDMFRPVFIDEDYINNNMDIFFNIFRTDSKGYRAEYIVPRRRDAYNSTYPHYGISGSSDKADYTGIVSHGFYRVGVEYDLNIDKVKVSYELYEAVMFNQYLNTTKELNYNIGNYIVALFVALFLLMSVFKALYMSEMLELSSNVLENTFMSYAAIFFLLTMTSFLFNYYLIEYFGDGQVYGVFESFFVYINNFFSFVGNIYINNIPESRLFGLLFMAVVMIIHYLDTKHEIGKMINAKENNNEPDS